jgi:hypothetical protein
MSHTYRFYSLDGVGHLHSADWIEAEGDEAALALIQGRHPNGLYEIWLGDRLVAKRSPDRQYG